MDANLLLRYRKYLMSIEMIYLCLMVIISAIQAIVIDVPATADSLRGKTVYTLFTDRRTWKEAREVCREHGGYLINIETEEKYRRYKSLKTSPTLNLRTGNKLWIGLYWQSSTSRHWDGPGCPPPRTNLTESYHWKDTDDFEYDSNKVCYRVTENDMFDRHNCHQKNQFICEHYDTCGYEESRMTAFTVSVPGNGTTTTLIECKTDCDNTSGCFLTANIENGCAMLLATGVSTKPIAIKNCSYETAKVIENQHETRDASDPTDCATITLSSVLVPGNDSASSNKPSERIDSALSTQLGDDDVCRYEESTITSFTSTYRQDSNNATTLDECKTVCDNTSGCFLTANIDNGCAMLLATDVSTTPIAIRNCSYGNVSGNDSASSDQLSDVSSTITVTRTITETSTATLSTGTGSSSFDVSTVTETQTQSCDTITGSDSSPVLYGPEMAVSTVTETQTQSCETVTVDVTGSSSSTVLYSSGMAPAIDATIQPSFNSSEVNEIISSSPTGIKGTIGSDGIMRTLVCRDVIVVTPDPVAEQAAVKSIVDKLTVDKKNISAVVQKKVSAQDKRPSSVAIGYMGIVFLIIPFLLIIAVDLPTCVRCGRDVIKICKDEDIS